jgi:Protein of unknown function (DUF2934)
METMNRMEIERDEQIREIAYRIWQEEGCPAGSEVEHWLKAQSIWEENIARKANLNSLSH